MPTYNSDQLAQKVPQPGPSGDGGSVKRLYYTVSFAAAPTTADPINFGLAPKGVRVAFATLQASDMDSGTTLTLNIGDAGDVDRIFAAATVAQTGTYSIAPANTIVNYQYTNDTTMITGVALANGTGTPAGTLTLMLLGTFDPTPNT